MTNQPSLMLKAPLVSALSLAAAIAFAAVPAVASPGHGDDETDHQECMNHDEMSADEHDKDHDEGAQDCEEESQEAEDGHGDHQH